MRQLSAALLLTSMLFSCGPASNQPGNNLSNAAIDAIIASSKKSCTDELTKEQGAEMAGKICGCASSKVGDELKKDPGLVNNEQKLGTLMPGITAACVKELLGPAASPSPQPAS